MHSDNHPLISILMTAFNREDFISDAIESVLNSTYKNFELIIVDDCSKDNTLQIAKDYANKDHRISVYLNEKNLGDYPNRNKAASYAKGKYIKYLDADDTIYPWGIEVVVNYMEQFPEAGYGLDGIQPDPEKQFPILLNPIETYQRNYFKSPVFDKAPSSCIIRNEIFKQYGGFNINRNISDFEFWHKLSRKQNVLLMPHGIIWCRIHAGQESQLYRDNSVIIFKYSIVEIASLKNTDCPLPQNVRNLLIRKIERSQARSILRSLLIERSIKNTKEKLSLSGMNLLKVLVYSFRKYE
jgi:glycosyltransferase involved in cell wall biosynthesis